MEKEAAGCFSTSQDSVQVISYAGPSHVEVFSRHTKGQQC